MQRCIYVSCVCKGAKIQLFHAKTAKKQCFNAAFVMYNAGPRHEIFRKLSRKFVT